MVESVIRVKTNRSVSIFYTSSLRGFVPAQAGRTPLGDRLISKVRRCADYAVFSTGICFQFLKRKNPSESLQKMKDDTFYVLRMPDLGKSWSRSRLFLLWKKLRVSDRRGTPQRRREVKRARSIAKSTTRGTRGTPRALSPFA